MTQEPEKRSTEPEWLDPRNDRKTPYLEQELDLLVEGFVSSMGLLPGSRWLKRWGKPEQEKC